MASIFLTGTGEKLIKIKTIIRKGFVFEFLKKSFQPHDDLYILNSNLNQYIKNRNVLPNFEAGAIKLHSFCGIVSPHFGRCFFSFRWPGGRFFKGREGKIGSSEMRTKRL